MMRPIDALIYGATRYFSRVSLSLMITREASTAAPPPERVRRDDYYFRQYRPSADAALCAGRHTFGFGALLASAAL